MYDGCARWGNTPVILAASYGHFFALEYFVSLGAKLWKADRLVEALMLFFVQRLFVFDSLR